METTLNGQITLKVCLTQLIIIQIEKNFRFFLSIVDWFD